jgi:hypothetical protein
VLSHVGVRGKLAGPHDEKRERGPSGLLSRKQSTTILENRDNFLFSNSFISCKLI